MKTSVAKHRRNPLQLKLEGSILITNYTNPFLSPDNAQPYDVEPIADPKRQHPDSPRSIQDFRHIEIPVNITIAPGGQPAAAV